MMQEVVKLKELLFKTKMDIETAKIIALMVRGEKYTLQIIAWMEANPQATEMKIWDKAMEILDVRRKEHPIDPRKFQEK